MNRLIDIESLTNAITYKRLCQDATHSILTNQYSYIGYQYRQLYRINRPKEEEGQTFDSPIIYDVYDQHRLADELNVWSIFVKSICDAMSYDGKIGCELVEYVRQYVSSFENREWIRLHDKQDIFDNILCLKLAFIIDTPTWYLLCVPCFQMSMKDNVRVQLIKLYDRENQTFYDWQDIIRDEPSMSDVVMSLTLLAIQKNYMLLLGPLLLKNLQSANMQHKIL